MLDPIQRLDLAIEQLRRRSIVTCLFIEHHGLNLRSHLDRCLLISQRRFICLQLYLDHRYSLSRGANA